jgi:hypothetical protein
VVRRESVRSIERSEEETVSEASAEFHRGPHDGLVLEVDEIQRFCHLVRLGREDEERVFAMMPALLEWDRVIRGDLDKDGPFDTLYPYELEQRGDDAAFWFRRHDEFAEAVAASRGD